MSQMIWIASEAEAWEPAQLVSVESNALIVKRKSNGQEVKVPGTINSFDQVTQSALDEDCENLVNLEVYNEGIILHHVKKRFQHDKIYTMVGNILIAVNPYKTLDIYSMQIVDKIYNKVKNRDEGFPHIYTIGAAAVLNMREENKDQSVLISGESGAGKTEATKKILQFISAVCGSTASRVGVSIETQILDSNPLLESFGNAKTIRNNNSSRFGKYMEINFDKKHKIKGCNITSYLLEKSRVVTQGPNERNYHIFYMLLAGANKDMKKDFYLKPCDQFYYLNQTNCFEIDRRNDYKEFEELIYAMNNLGLDETIQYKIFQILSAVLHLGNLTFVSGKDAEGSKIVNNLDCKRVAHLLTVDSDALERVLCNKDAMINNESLLIPLTPNQANDQRDSLSKYLYNKLFEFIVYSINSSLYRGRFGNNIGVLDIFGFEVFEQNSFEQLCINYCNERLQTFFNEIIFDSEMKMYSLEGLPVDEISYQDNIGCVRLIDLRGGGIFAYLDEEVTIPKGTDEKFISKLNSIFDENPNTKSIYYLRNRKNPMIFTVRHFAGDVQYNVVNFLDKNRDSIAESLLSLIQTSTLPMITKEFTNLSSSSDNQTAVTETTSTKKKSTRTTLSMKFKMDLDNLMTILRSTKPHFIRCIKPNMSQVSNKFEGSVVLNQLKYSGLFEAIRIRKLGYELRIPHDTFFRRYNQSVLGSGNRKSKLSFDPKEVKLQCEELLSLLLDNVQKDEYFSKRKLQLEDQFYNKKDPNNKKAPPVPTPPPPTRREFFVGNSKVFFRTQLLKILFEEYRQANSSNVVIHIQRMIRGYIQRQRFKTILGEQYERKEQMKQILIVERSLMSQADEESYELEKAYRADNSLYERLLLIKKQRIEEERQRIYVLHTTNAIILQKYIRGFIYKWKARRQICEELFEQAIAGRSEEGIQRAIQFRLKYKLSSKLLIFYENNCKTLILQIMHENYLNKELQEAFTLQSLPLLRSALQSCDDQHMVYLSYYQPCQQLYYYLLQNKTLVRLLNDEISKCTSISLLISKYDILKYLLYEASQRMLHTEAIVTSTHQRLQRIDNLYKLKQALRHAVEICSPTRMRQMMIERHKMVKLYGDDFLGEEIAAIENMMNMLKFKQTLLDTDITDSIQSIVQLPMNSEPVVTRSKRTQSNESIKTTQSTKDKETVEEKDNSQGSMNELKKLTMHEIFHYIMHHCESPLVLDDFSISPETVKFGGSSEESNDEIQNNNTKTDDPEVIYLPRFVREPLYRMRYSTSKRDLEEAISEFARLVPNEFHRHFYLRVFKWTIAFSYWTKPNQLLEDIQKQLAPISEDDLLKLTSLSLSKKNTDQSTPNNKTNSQTMKANETFQSPKKTTKFMTSSSSEKKPQDTSLLSSTQKKTVTIAPRPSTSFNTTNSQLGKSPDSKLSKTKIDDLNIPFATRQAKSVVAAREFLKKGKQYHFRHFEKRTDSLLQESLQDIAQFRANIPKKSTWSG